MPNTQSESTISEINTNVFFKEFTYRKNDFKDLNSKQKLEFADNVVWLDEILFIYQIKERTGNDANALKWFDNKVLNKGVKQIKATLKYLSSYPEILIENEKGHKLNIADARGCNKTRKIIIYAPGANFPEEKRRVKFYESKEVELIHIFHSEDYYWICKYLYTPSEVDEYLDFRERLFTAFPKDCDHLSEQYFLGHFMETPLADHIDGRYILNLQNKQLNPAQYDITFLMENFSNNISLSRHPTEYYYIIKEISKLNRSELHEFLKRFIKCYTMCNKNQLVNPYRLYTRRTDCAFIFLPIPTEKAGKWKILLQNYTLLNKYDQKARKSIGMAMIKDKERPDHFQLFWMLAESEWKFNESIENAIKEQSPFGKVHTKKIVNRYKTG